MMPVPPDQIRITRSYRYRLNAGNYESRDFYCSQSIECPASHADAASERVHAWCRRQVLAAVREYQQGKEQ